MTLEEFRAAALALLGLDWRPRLAERLDVPLRTVEQWATGQAPLPEEVELFLKPGASEPIALPEWLTADDGGEPSRYYILHLAHPRFILRVAGEGELMAGTSFSSFDEQFGELAWLDLPRPEVELRQWLKAAAAWWESLPD